MSRIPASSATSAAQRSFASTDAINDLDLGTFLELMIAELQNQDPLNPLDNKDMLAQISQIREVGATDRLTDTLDSVLLGQNIASATNLIGADITALSDDAENVEGIVSRVSIDKGVPKLQIEKSTAGEPSSADGNIEEGKYSYRVVWENQDGKLFGIDLSGDKAVTTTGSPGVDQSIVLRNLPVTPGQKKIYRTDASGGGAFQLVGILNNGSQGSFVDTMSDEERSETRLTLPFQQSTLTTRKYVVSLNNVSGIRPPGQNSNTPGEDGTIVDDTPRPEFVPTTRPPFSS